MEDAYERTLLMKNECFVYALPPRTSNRGYRAADWGLDKPLWTGRLKISTFNGKLSIKLLDSEGNLFAEAPVPEYPGVAVESVTDSSRYFILRIINTEGKVAFIGAGFGDRGDAFDFNVTLQDHFKRVKTDEKIEQAPVNQPNLDLGLKAGQTFRINIGNSAGKSKPKTKTNPTGGLLLPPPPAAATSQTTSNDKSDWGEFSSASNDQWVQF
uniref:NECAP PHear domain-containing protein n=1 Tax=Ciona savignyi TaxID=51511 RepID=H2ZRB7_CIOSA